MNSIVNFLEYGTNINIQNSNFHHMNLCGSVLKNTFEAFHYIDWDYVEANYFDDIAKEYISYMSTQYDIFYDYLYDQYYTVPDSNPFTECTSGSVECFDLILQNNVFEYIPFN